MNMVVPAGAMYVTHNEFNTALALAACAQKSMGKLKERERERE